jgi:diaminopimelate epimerase
MNVQFYKYEGTGNDFIILDNRNNQYDHLSKAQVKFMCDRHFGIGADGLMLLNVSEGYDFGMRYYNSDGGESSMCGNGGRCLVKFAYDMGIHLDTFRFLAIDGPHDASFDDKGWVQLKMKNVYDISIHHYGDAILDTGSPHYVKIVSDIWNYNVVEEGKKIRYSKEFKEKGINVNFVETTEDEIMVRTYERGVENETLSCGTGVTAAALVCAHNDQGFNRVEVQTLGGHLAVEFEKHVHNKFTDVWLCGPATYVFKGEIKLK